MLSQAVGTEGESKLHLLSNTERGCLNEFALLSMCSQVPLMCGGCSLPRERESKVTSVLVGGIISLGFFVIYCFNPLIAGEQPTIVDE